MNNRRSFLNQLASLSVLTVPGAGAYGLSLTRAHAAETADGRLISFNLNSFDPGRTYILEHSARPISVRVLSAADETTVSNLPESPYSTSPTFPGRLDQEQQITTESVPATPENLVQGHGLRAIILVQICPYLGCMPVPISGDYADADGYFCPCHGSQFDMLGRYRSGPSRANMTMLMVDFISDTEFQIPFNIPAIP